jgi:phosphotransferase system HPr (HPr) family protein
MKINHLQQESKFNDIDAIGGALLPVSASKTICLTIGNQLGLHARPAAQFVATANEFAADVQVIKRNKLANAKSINQVIMLAVRQGEEIQIIATGADADHALAALKTLVESHFSEPKR